MKIVIKRSESYTHHVEGEKEKACIDKFWNKLPANTDFSSIESFKRTLDGFNFNVYCDI